MAPNDEVPKDLYYSIEQLLYSERVGPQTRAAGAISQLEEILNPNGTRLYSFRNTMLISLDLDYDQNRGIINQVGISTLDTSQSLR